MIKFTWSYNDVKIVFGPSAIDDLKNYLVGVKNVVIVTGRSSAIKSGAQDDVTKFLNELSIRYSIFNKVTPNPLSTQADELARAIALENVDCLIAIGGGSVIDTAKVASAVAANGGSAIDYLYGRKDVKRTVPVFAINLTHGTGSEVDRYANMTDAEKGDKLGNVVSYPKVSFDDPRYTITLPKEQVLCTSFDALYHAYESSTTLNSPPLARTLSEEAVRLISKYLPRAMQSLQDMEARYYLLYASMLAGIAIDLSPTNIIHAIENVMSGIKPSLPHGCGLAIVGPLLAPLVHMASPEGSTRILRVLDPNVKPNSDPGLIRDVLSNFVASVGFSKRLGDYGFDKETLSEAIRRAFSNPAVLEKIVGRLHGINVDKQKILELLKEAL
ncbi:MAG: iron-containing alcohol dehydrogenase [Caldisphaeraceae archaeon]|nr:iron-containing alcohol dehydrogenase [Caldisphaeraceae archaeon]